jgi:hypothetical protein
MSDGNIMLAVEVLVIAVTAFLRVILLLILLLEVAEVVGGGESESILVLSYSLLEPFRGLEHLLANFG